MKQLQAYLISNLPSSSPRSILLTFTPLFSKAHFANSAPPGGSQLQKRRIMVVDDQKDIAMMFRSGLERNGFSVEVFNDPLKALSHFRPGHYDLLLLDVRMPRMSGFELCKEIRKQDRTAKVCFVSAFEVHGEEMKKYLSEEDEKCIIKKPVSMNELVKIINEEISDKH